MFPEDLAAAVHAVLVDSAGLELAPDLIRVERPPRPELGDYATPVALSLIRARLFARTPVDSARTPTNSARTSVEWAELIAVGLRTRDEVESATVVASGFVNVRLTAEALAATARCLRARKNAVRQQDSREDSERQPGSRKGALGPNDTAAKTGTNTEHADALGRAETRVAETLARLGMLLRGAEALGVPEEPLDLGDLAAPDQRRLICALAETAAVVARAGRLERPELLLRHQEELIARWERVESVQPVQPIGDELPGTRHSSGRLLASVTYTTLTDVHVTLQPSSVVA